MFIIVHGYDGSGPGHWQWWLADTLRARGLPVSFPALPAPTEPDRDTWVAALAAEVQSAQARRDRIFFVAHSLGCWAVDHLISDLHRQSVAPADGLATVVAGALLVAPPSPFSLFEPIQSFLPPPRSRAAWAPLAGSSLLVGSDNDEYAAPDELEEAAARMGLPFKLMPGAGHINAAAGFGPLPAALSWLAELGALDA